MRDPVHFLGSKFIDNLGQDWEILDDPEGAVLGVPQGAVARALEDIDQLALWDSLMRIADGRSDQWLVDLSFFIPFRGEFVYALHRFLDKVSSPGAMVSLAQDADRWPWGACNYYLLPRVIDRVEEISRGLVGTDYDASVSVLRDVASKLRAKI